MKVTAAALALAAPLVQAFPYPSGSESTLYFLDDNVAGSSIVSLKVGQDGSLSSPVKTSTGGKGLIGRGTTGPNTADPLFCQDSVVVVGNHLFTVNAGSNTLASFYIPADDPQHPVLMGEPVSSGGKVPNTVAYSARNKIVCVANTGPEAGVMCYRMSDCGSLEPQGNYRPLPVDQTPIPLGPPNTVSDISFNPSETAVFVTIKGDGTGSGYVYAFPVVDGCVSDHAVVSRPEELKLDFSITFMTDESAVISDPSYGASFVHIDDDLKVSVSHLINITGEGATCWSRYSREFDSVFIFDAASPNITTLDPATGNTKYVIPGKAAGMGALDSVIVGDWMYTLEGAAAISVVDLKGGKVPSVSQYFSLADVGSRPNFSGLAAYTPSW